MTEQQTLRTAEDDLEQLVNWPIFYRVDHPGGKPYLIAPLTTIRDLLRLTLFDCYRIQSGTMDGHQVVDATWRGPLHFSRWKGGI